MKLKAMVGDPVAINIAAFHTNANLGGIKSGNWAI